MQRAVLLMRRLGIVLHASQGAACQQGGIEDADGKAGSEVDAREFGGFLEHGCFSPLPDSSLSLLPVPQHRCGNCPTTEEVNQ